MKKDTKTKQQLLLEREELRTRLDATEQRLQEANEIFQAEVTERKRVEETFEKAQKYAESIVETIREPLVVLTPDLRVISANHSFYQTFKVSPKETEGKFLYDIGNRQWNIPALQELLEEIIPRNTHFNDFEVDHEFPAIGHRTMILNARRIHREDNGTERILLAIEDITERKQSEEAVKISETRYRRLFETAQDGILILDANTGQISDVNPFLTEMLGYSYEEFFGRKLWEIGAFKDIQASKTAFSELQIKGYVRYEDLPLETRDGRLMDVEFVSNVYLVDHRKVIQCNIRDITQRKKAEEKLRASEQRYRSYVEVTGQLGWTTNADGEVVEDIPAWRKFTGQSEEKIKGGGWTKALHPDDVEHTMEAWNKAVATKSPYEIEYRLRRYDGVYRHLLARGVPVYKEDGSIQEWVGTCIDITERKKVEGALHKAYDELEQRVEERTVELRMANEQLKQEIEERKKAEDSLRESEKQLRYLSSRLLTAQETERRRVSRELHDESGGTLAVLKLRLSSIRKNLKEDQPTLREECDMSLKHIDKLIESIHRISRNLSPSILEDLGLSAALRWLIDDFGKNYNVRVILEMMDIDHLFPQEAQIIIYRIFQEAFTNIGKHAQAKNVSAVIKKQDDTISFLLEDDGKGFDVKQAIMRDAMERGLGLATMDERIKMVGGSLDLRSQDGKGTQIIFSIPTKRGGIL